jgi:DNA-binding MarR family transcriptional regulator
MFSAYKLEIGRAFPSADPRLVLQILRECVKTESTSQVQLEQVTWVPQPTLAKVIKKMISCQWLEVSNRDPTTASKTVQISPSGRAVLRDLERACQRVAKKVTKKKISST